MWASFPSQMIGVPSARTGMRMSVWVCCASTSTFDVLDMSCAWQGYLTHRLPRVFEVVSGRLNVPTRERQSGPMDDTAFRTNSNPEDTSTQDNGHPQHAVLQYLSTAIHS